MKKFLWALVIPSFIKKILLSHWDAASNAKGVGGCRANDSIGRMARQPLEHFTRSHLCDSTWRQSSGLVPFNKDLVTRSAVTCDGGQTAHWETLSVVPQYHFSAAEFGILCVFRIPFPRYIFQLRTSFLFSGSECRWGQIAGRLDLTTTFKTFLKNGCHLDFLIFVVVSCLLDFPK